VGDLRWKAPQPAKAWKGDLDATKYGHHCAQNHVFDDMIFQDSPTPEDRGSEDCLTLNVYAPSSEKSKDKLPVMFWIHGGGYSGGGSSEPRHNGDFLPLKGVVLVTINYRLGVFGFLALPDLATEQGGASGNYGLMDMVAALEWARLGPGSARAGRMAKAASGSATLFLQIRTSRTAVLRAPLHRNARQ
jgi:para-nitrobenzyl esterase